MELILRDVVDPNESNGICYSAPNSETKGNFIPCGNSDIGAWACCYVGDYCLGFRGVNGCYDSSTGNTYLAGCTDSSFDSLACPSKHQFGSQEWVGITWCSQGSGTDDTAWGGCSVPDDLTTLISLPHSSCDPYCATPIYTGGTSLKAYASLPSSAGGVIAYTGGFDPLVEYPITTTSTPRTTSKPTSTNTHTIEILSTHHTITTTTTMITPITTTSSQTRLTLSQSTSTQSASVGVVAGEAAGDSGGSSLSTGAKAGIGVGASAGGILVIGAILLALFFRRRSKKNLENQSHAPEQGQYYGQAGDIVVSPRPWQGPNMSTTAYPATKPEVFGDAAYSPEQYSTHWATPTVGSAAYERNDSELAVPESTTSRLSPSPYVSSGSPHSAQVGYEHSNRVSAFSDTSTAQGDNWRYVSS